MKEKIKDIFIMGGNYKGRGNILAASESNFYEDAEAAHIVLSSLNCPITIVPLECGTDDKITLVNIFWLKKWFKIWIVSFENSFSQDWRFNVLGKVDNENVKLLNEIEKIAYYENPNYEPFDAIVAAVFVFPEKCIRKQRARNFAVELQGIFTRGQMVFDHQNCNDTVTVIERVNTEEIKNILLWATQEKSMRKPLWLNCFGSIELKLIDSHC